MIYIKETLLQDSSVEIRVDGVLDAESIPTLAGVCQKHLDSEKKILLHIEGLLHISREGMDFLRVIQKKVVIIDPLPRFKGVEPI